MNSDLNFGKIDGTLHEFVFFLETIETHLGVYIKYYYRITDDSFIQVAVSVEESELEIYAQYKLKYASIKENIKFVIENMFEANLLFCGYPVFYNSKIFSCEEFDKDIIGKMKDQKELIEKKTKENKTPLITYLEKQGLEPIPSGTNIGSWMAKCPNGKKHFIMVVSKSGEWGCGYCKKKGKIEELKKWMSEIKSKKD